MYRLSRHVQLHRFAPIDNRQLARSLRSVVQNQRYLRVLLEADGKDVAVRRFHLNSHGVLVDELAKVADGIENGLLVNLIGG